MLPTISMVFDRKHNRKVEACVYYEGKRRYLSTGVTVPEDAIYKNGIISGCVTAPSLNKTLNSAMTLLQQQLQEQIDRDTFSLSAFSLSLTYMQGNFYEWAKEKNKAGTTRQSTKNEASHILEKWHSLGLTAFTDVTAKKINTAIQKMAKQGMMPTTIRAYLAVLGKFIREAVSQGLIKGNPLQQVQRPKGKGKEVCYLTQEELTAVEGFSGTDKQNSARDMFLFACYTGLAYSDLTKIVKKDVLTIDGKKYIIDNRKKTGSKYKLRLMPKALAILKAHGYNLNLMKNTTANNNLRAIQERIGIGKNISMHVGRHTFATLALSNGVRIETVSRMLAHSDIKTTQIYAKVLQKDVDEGFDLLESKI